LIEHRVNSVALLDRIPVDRGVEVDIRDYDGALRLVHDPLRGGERLDDFLKAFRHRLLILNVKCDGLEGRILSALEKHRIERYFFLDVANPTLVSLVRLGVRQIAVRYSEFEPIESSLAFAGKVDWVWIDCFTRLPLDQESWSRLRAHFKLCLVSPELQQHPRGMIQEFRRQLRDMPVDAVCSDYCSDWVRELPRDDDSVVRDSSQSDPKRSR
jgi:hypothetical protein